mgnify:CR=1 FL=1
MSFLQKIKRLTSIDLPDSGDGQSLLPDIQDLNTIVLSGIDDYDTATFIASPDSDNDFAF